MKFSPRHILVAISTLFVLLAVSLPALTEAGGADDEERRAPVGDEPAGNEGSSEISRSQGAGPARAPGLNGATPRTRTFTQTTDQTFGDFHSVQSLVTVSGMGSYVWDVDLLVSINHTAIGILDVSLTSPEGTTTVISSKNAFTHSNSSAPTLFDDQSGLPVTDVSFSHLDLGLAMAAEGSLSAFQGENPAGVWILSVSDTDGFGDTGTLLEWSLRLTTFSSPPVSRLVAADNPTDFAIPDEDTVRSTIDVSGMGFGNNGITDLNLTTFITHTSSVDLDVTITSPEGTIVILTTDSGLTFDNLFNGTVWDDQAGTPVTDYDHADGVVSTPLQPEGGLAAFNGEDANGVWTLTITDDEASETGTLNGWRLDIRAGAVATCAGLQATILRNGGGGTVNGTNGPDVIVVRNGSYLVKGNGGNDVICAGGGNDDLRGGNGDDQIFGGSGGDKIRGDGGTDQLYGKGGADKLDGGSGASDLCVGGGGPDTSLASCETIRP